MEDISTIPSKKIYVSIVDESEYNPLLIDIEDFDVKNFCDLDQDYTNEKFIISFVALTDEEFKKIPEWQGF